MKRPVHWLLAAGLLSLITGCSGDDSSNAGGAFFVQSCSLGCSSGQGGAQVSCAIVNTFQNQEISFEFSQPVSLSSVNANSFQIFDVITGATPTGTTQIDPLNNRRLIFRPALVFSAGGGVEFGFQPNRSYQVFIPGIDQGDTGPFLQGTGGKENRSRLSCTITTSLGISDPVPGSPTVATFVDTIDPISGGVVTDVPANGATNVWLDTQITFTFNDLMDIGSLVNPATGTSPSITVAVDGDGDPSTPADQVSVAGTYTFDVDLTNLATTLVFTPSGGLPSAGTGFPRHRIFVTLPLAIVDLAGNSISNPGVVIFEPEAIGFPAVDLTESFTSTTNFEDTESGANTWGQSKPGGLGGQMLGKGIGGGSGRLGRFVIDAGPPTTIDTSPIAATGSLFFSAVPCDGETFEFDGQIFTFRDAPMAATDLPIITPPGAGAQPDQGQTVDESARLLNLLAFSQPLTFTPIGPNEIRIEAVPGSAGNSFQIVAPGGSLPSDTTACGGGAAAVLASGFTLSGGSDGALFPARTLIDNFDYQANPGGTPNDILIADGVFEFSSVSINPGARLIVRGDNPVRFYSRGNLTIASNSFVDLSGGGLGPHDSAFIDGIPGGVGGPNGGRGGRGGDRDDVTDAALLGQGAIMNMGGVDAGSNGEGVGQGALAAGQGGISWPAMPIVSQTDLGDTRGVLDSNFECTVAKIPGPGSGGAYALDGGDGTTVVPLLVVDAATGVPEPAPVDTSNVLNQPDPDFDMVAEDTAGGNAGALGIEPPAAPPNVRLLDPDDGNLRGGSGGGGAGGGLYGSLYFGDFASSTCDADPTFGAQFNPYVSHSGASGGGGGGAGQFHSGARLQLSGSILAGGGEGGSGIQPPGDPMSDAFLDTGWAVPGGGGSGGAVLVQGETVTLATSAGIRISVVGGLGGVGLQSTLGGDGSPGLMRVEDAIGAVNSVAVAAVTAPQTPNASEDVLSVGPGAFSLTTTLPGGFQGAQSCWMKPDGNFFALVFDDDAPPAYGWDAQIVVDFSGTPEEISYRDPAQNGGIPALGGQSAQEFWGNLIDRDLTGGQTPAPFVIRFQGAQALDIDFNKVQPTDAFGVACDVDDSAQSAQIQNLTPWVQHPAELNAFQPPPNMIRWVVIYDASHPDADRILGVSDVLIGSNPD